MGIAEDGLQIYMARKRRQATQWFARHGVAAASVVGAKRTGAAAWRGAYSGIGRAGDAIRASIDALRGEQEVHSPDPIRRAGDVRDDAARAARSTDSPSGQALAMAAGLLAEEAETVQGATATTATLGGITTGLTAYAHAVAHLAETVRGRRGDRAAVQAIDALAAAVADLAGEAASAHRRVASLYASQVEQEDQTGTTLK